MVIAMGTNVQKRAQKSFAKHVDTAMKEVANNDLFDEAPETCPRQFVAEPTRVSDLKTGDKINLEIDGTTVLGTQGPDTVFRVSAPPPDVIAHVRSNSGIAEASISKVNPLSGTVEVDLC